MPTASRIAPALEGGPIRWSGMRLRLFGVYVGVLAWAAVWLRDAQLRTLLPWRRT